MAIMSKDAKAKRKRRAHQTKVRQRAQQIALAALRVSSEEYPSADAVASGPITDQIFRDQPKADLFFALTNLASRISDHIQRVDRGVYYAVDDLAVALRVLLKTGQGSGLLLRCVDEFEVEMPFVVVSKPAPMWATLGVGLIPVWRLLPGHRVNESDDRRFFALRLDDWLKLDRGIVYRRDDGELSKVSWEAFIGHYANRLSGAHLDRRGGPEYLYKLDWNGAGGLALSNYLLRTLGVLAFELIQEVLYGVAAKLGIALSDGFVFAGPGAPHHYPEMQADLGMLMFFAYSKNGMEFEWHVDEESRLSRMRLFFNNAVWDYSWTTDSGLSADKYQEPLSEYIYQAPRYPRYPDQQAGSLHVSPAFIHLPYVRTLADLRDGVAHAWPDDFHPNAPSPGWQSDPPLKPFVATIPEDWVEDFKQQSPDNWLGDADTSAVRDEFVLKDKVTGDYIIGDRRDASGYVRYRGPRPTEGSTDSS